MGSHSSHDLSCGLSVQGIVIQNSHSSYSVHVTSSGVYATPESLGSNSIEIVISGAEKNVSTAWFMEPTKVNLTLTGVKNSGAEVDIIANSTNNGTADFLFEGLFGNIHYS